MSTTTLFIDGAWVAASDGGTRQISCPADGTPVGTVSEATTTDVEAAIRAARTAFDTGTWPTTPAPERGDFLLRVAAGLRDRKAAFARAETLDTGKRLVESEIDIDDIANCFTYFGKLAGQDAGRIVDAGDESVLSRIVHEPVGVCGLIAPWNYPLLQAAWKIAPALAAGNTLVVKPAEDAPLSILHLATLITEAGVPDGVVNVVPGFGATAGQALVEHPDVDKISFTGSPEVGRRIGATAAQTFKRVVLELGGKSPQIIFGDANVEAAIGGSAMGLFFNQGEVCAAGTRILDRKSVV